MIKSRNIIYSITLLLLCLFTLTISANSISNRFFVQDRTQYFTNTRTSGIQCKGLIHYPRLSHNDREIFYAINKKIVGFANHYKTCNKGRYNDFSVSYGMPDTLNEDSFSVVWTTKKFGEIVRIDSLNFNYGNGTLLGIDDIFHLVADQMMHKIVKLSAGHLNTSISWEEFVKKVERRDIQFYMNGQDWYIVFNPKHYDYLDPKEFNRSNVSNIDIVDVKIPKDLLIEKIDYDLR